MQSLDATSASKMSSMPTPCTRTGFLIGLCLNERAGFAARCRSWLLGRRNRINHPPSDVASGKVDPFLPFLAGNPFSSLLYFSLSSQHPAFTDVVDPRSFCAFLHNP